MMWFGVLSLAVFASLPLGAVAQSHPVPRPVDRTALSQAITISAAVRPLNRAAVQADVSAQEAGFQAWLAEFRKRARHQGISQSVLIEAFQGVNYDPEIIARDRNQSEFTKTIWEYLDRAVSSNRIQNGKRALQKHRNKLEAIEAHYGVDKEIIVAIWGLETAYGTHRGKLDVIQSLATLAYDGRRGAFFESQLIAALKILQSGDTTARNMQGSWAGAMGHTQFMPTSYLDYAVDFGGDERRDIWSDNPSDALASSASYLKQFGWQKDAPWGVEVILPEHFNYALASRKIKKSPDEWARIGITAANGRKLPDTGQASVLLPAGAQGAAFLIYKNFSVIERYNSSDAYVLGVGHLSDRIAGKPHIQAKWPRSQRALSMDEREELQRRLTHAGYDTQGIDGRIGPQTIRAIRAYQRAHGLIPDGYASLALLKSLRQRP